MNKILLYALILLSFKVTKALKVTNLEPDNVDKQAKSLNSLKVVKPQPLKNLNFLLKDAEYFQDPVFKNLEIIYSENQQPVYPVLLKSLQQIDLKLSQLFPISPYFRKNTVFFPSHRYQIPNAYASIDPRPFVAIYPSSSIEFIDHYSIFNWSQDVLLHEITHIYQLLQSDLIGERKAWWFYPLGDLTWGFYYKNKFLNTFFLEGHAVFNESLFGHGGRLFSGWARAFVFSQIKQDILFKQVLSSYKDPFSGLQKYLHGAYFFAYLHSQYGTKKLYDFFIESNQRFAWGFWAIKKASLKVFGKSIQLLFKDYKNHYKALASKQQSLPGQALLKSKARVFMNSDKDKIYFLISNEKSMPQLVFFDKKTKKITTQKMDLPIGKMFYLNGVYYSSASAQTSSTSIEFSLFKDGFKPFKKYNSQIVMDFYNQKALSLDTKQNHFRNMLLFNKKFYDFTDSSAIVDPKGRIYYFKQNNNKRTLYRDKKPVFSFSSYYAYPVEADKTGLYFISSTKYGSGLFVYKQGEGVFRLSVSDRITHAKKINKDEFLVAELSPTHHEFKVIKAQKIPQKPVSYSYSFKKQNIFTTAFKQNKATLNPIAKNTPQTHNSNLNPIAKNTPQTHNSNLNLIGKNTPQTHNSNLNPIGKNTSQTLTSNLNSIAKNTQLSLAPKPYRPFKNLSLSSLAVALDLNSETFQSSFRLSDPLKFNSLIFQNSINLKDKNFGLLYSYEKYRPILALGLEYEENFLSGPPTQILKDLDFLSQNLVTKEQLFHRKRAFRLSLTYPLFKTTNNKLLLTNSLELGQRQFNNEQVYFKKFPHLFFKSQPWKNYLQYRILIEYKDQKKYKYAYSYHKRRIFSLFYEFLSVGDKLSIKNQGLSGWAYAHITQELGSNYFITLNSLLRRSLWSAPEMFFQREDLTLYFRPFKFKKLQDIYRIDLQILKALNQSLHYPYLDFSLRNWAPLLGGSFLLTQPFSKGFDIYFIPFIGLELETSFFEKGSIYFGTSASYIIESFKKPFFHPDRLAINAWIKTGF